MNKEAFEQRGIVIAHAFYNELEKIAARAEAFHAGQQAVKRLAGQADDFGKIVGWKKHLPFSQQKRTYDAMKAKATKARKATDRVAKKRELEAMQALEQGVQGSRLNKSMDYLKAVQGARQERPSVNPFMRKKPAPKPVVQMPQGMPQTPMGQAAMIGGGGAIAGGAGILAAQQAYRQRQAQQYGYA